MGFVNNVQNTRIESLLKLRQRESKLLLFQLVNMLWNQAPTFASIVCWTGPTFALSMKVLRNTEEGRFSGVEEYWRWRRRPACLGRRSRFRSMKGWDCSESVNRGNSMVENTSHIYDFVGLKREFPGWRGLRCLCWLGNHWTLKFFEMANSEGLKQLTCRLTGS